MSGRRVLTLNAGSSSLKLAVFEIVGPETAPRRVTSRTVSRLGEAPSDYSRSLDAALTAVAGEAGLDALAAVGHRVVHGGPRHGSPCLLTDDVLDDLRSLADLDPDHMPACVALIEAMRARAPALAQVACFDTAFHRTMPRVARRLAIPRRYEALGVERYGFHGLSYAFLVEELARVGRPREALGRVVMAHLGAGASLAALRDGRSVDTTMGFTPNSGIAMPARSGDLEPGVILYLLRSGGLDVDAVDELLGRRSGLLGIAETGSDVRDLLARRATDPRAAEAIDLFCYQARKAVGAMAATLGGLDTLVFSGGIGENAAPIRAEIARGLEHLGVVVDEARNASSSAVISTDASACTVRVIRTDEEAILARETLRTIGALH